MKIRGTTVSTPIKPERILCTPQALTDEQKAQARENIGVPGKKTENGGELFNNADSASGVYSHAEGNQTTASHNSAHAEGYLTEASGEISHAEGSHTKAKGRWSHAEGYQTTAQGEAAHAEGINCEAIGKYSHAEGNSAKAEGLQSHAEGNKTQAYGAHSHAEGNETYAGHSNAHAEGYKTRALGKMSHTEGSNTVATAEAQHVQGKYNIEDTEGKYAHIVGNGKYGAPSNAYTLDWEGNAWYAGGLVLDNPGADKVGSNVWTSQNVVDRLCPSFAKSGWEVTCEPVAGYPLAGGIYLPASESGYTGVTLRHFAGENLLNPAVGTTESNGVTFTVAENGSITANGTATATIYYRVDNPTRSEGKAYTLIGTPSGGSHSTYCMYTSMGIENKFSYDTGKGVTFTAEKSGAYTYFIMIQAGITVDNLVFHPALYLAEGSKIYSVDFGKTVHGGTYSWNTGELMNGTGETTQLTVHAISALDGVNTLHTDVGIVVVGGRADPVAIINKLTNAILALGGNV